MKNYSIIKLDRLFVTKGINSKLNKEFSIRSKKYGINDISLIIDHILDYLIASGKIIKNFETFGCGSWLLQFVENDNYFEIHELKKIENEENIYEFNLDTTIDFFKSQLELCSSLNISPSIPNIGQKVAISREIYEGSEVNGVRYDSPDHMSGWYLTSNSYNGDIKTLSIDYLFFVLKSRPELARFLALPSGYRFFKDEIGDDVWYDEDI